MSTCSGAPPVVGQYSEGASSKIYLEEKGNRPSEVTFNSSQAKKLQAYGAMWKASNLRPPNYFLTINFSKSEKLAPLLADFPASSIWAQVYRSIDNYYSSHRVLWLCTWTMETRNGRHVHALIRVPRSKGFRAGLAELLLSKTGMELATSVKPWSQVQWANTNEPVCIERITDTKSFRGRPGLDGLDWYIAKDIDRNARSRIICRRLGRLVGASRTIVDLNQRGPISEALPHGSEQA